MQNRTALWIFIILLAAACIYSVSFTFSANSENSAADAYAQNKLDSVLSLNSAISSKSRDSILSVGKSDYIKNNVSNSFLGFTMDEVRKKQINRGLDLQGGMNVTLEVSVVDLVRNLAANKQDKEFKAAIQKATELQKNSGSDFVTLFGQAYNEIAPNGKLAAIFHSRDNKDLIPRSASNAEVLTILSDEAKAAVSRTEQVIRKRIDNLGVVQPKVQRLESGRILVELPGVKEKARVRKILQGTAKLEFWETYDNTEFFTYLNKANTLLKNELKAEQSANTQTDSLVAEKEGLTTTQDSSSALEDLLTNQTSSSSDSASASIDFKEENPLFAVLSPSLTRENNIQKGPVVGYASKNDTSKVNAFLKRENISVLFPRAKLLWGASGIGDAKDFFQLFAIKVANIDGKAPLEGDVVVDARQDFDQLGRSEVSLAMNSDGAKRWKTLTGNNIGNSVAIVLDDKVYSSPTVQGEIAGGRTSISGSFDVQEAEDLASILKAGKLPAPSRIIEEAVVGPSLGEENVNSSFKSFLLALGLVLIYMILYYNKAGVVANIALLANIFFVIGVLASLGATLTLPGIAGIVLTIGMSLDANVLFFERVREELRAGKGTRLAIKDAYGFKGALPSILDANVTSIITAFILLLFATGPVQGFATTLLIGIFTSLVSAIFITRLIFEWMLDRKMNLDFETGFSRNLFRDLNINFVEKRKVFYLVSLTAVLISLGSLFTKGLDLGVDFSGGRTFQVRFDEPVAADKIASNLGDVFVENGKRDVPEVKTYGASNQVLVTTNYLIGDNSSQASDLVEEKLKDGLASMNNTFEIVSSQKVGPTIADDIKSSSFYATIFALIAIFLYIGVRFKKMQFGTGAIAALFHDVIIVLGLYSLLWGILPFSLEIDQAFIAAILTVVGYSVNDTVVIFDRIREYLGIYRKESKNSVVNKALNSTLTRTFNTSITTLIVLALIFMFGGESIQGFVFAIMIGVFVGTYSSLFIATPVMLDLDKSDTLKKDAIRKNEEAKKKKRKAKKKQLA